MNAKQACIRLVASNRAAAAAPSLAAPESVKTLCDSDANFRRLQALFSRFSRFSRFSQIFGIMLHPSGPILVGHLYWCLAPPHLDRRLGGGAPFQRPPPIQDNGTDWQPPARFTGGCFGFQSFRAHSQVSNPSEAGIASPINSRPGFIPVTAFPPLLVLLLLQHRQA